MNKKGFTMIEVLAVIIILGILSMIGIYAVSSNIEESRKSAFVDNGIAYCEQMVAMRARDQLPIEINDYRGILIPIDKLKGTDKINDLSTPYGDLDLNSSYVVMVKQDRQIKYYLTMVTTDGTAIINVEYNDLSTDWVMNVNADYSEGEENQKYKEKLEQIKNLESLYTTPTLKLKIMAGTDEYTTDKVKEDYIILMKQNG